MAVREYKFKVSVDDVNANALCTNKAILRFFETASCFHSDEAGFGILDIPRTRLTWVLIAWKAQIISRPKYGADVAVRTWARDEGKAFTFRDFEMLDSKGEIIAIATTKWVLIDLDKGLVFVNDLIKNTYSPEDKRVFPTSRIEKLREPDSVLLSGEIKVSRRDIDINKHVHNLNYIDFAGEIMPYEAVQRECGNIEIYYKTEAKQNDLLTLNYAQINSQHFVTVKNGDILCAIVKLYDN